MSGFCVEFLLVGRLYSCPGAGYHCIPRLLAESEKVGTRPPKFFLDYKETLFLFQREVTASA